MDKLSSHLPWESEVACLWIVDSLSFKQVALLYLFRNWDFVSSSFLTHWFWKVRPPAYGSGREQNCYQKMFSVWCAQPNLWGIDSNGELHKLSGCTLLIWIAWKRLSSSSSKLNGNSECYRGEFFASYYSE